MLLASGNQAAEPQFHAILPQGVSAHVSRIKLTGSSEKELLAVADRADEAAALVADSGASLVLFHCTAVSTFSAELEESIKARIARASGKPVAATSEAIVAALRAVSAVRIVMVSYMDASRSASVLTLVLAEPGCCGLISGLRCRAFALRP